MTGATRSGAEILAARTALVAEISRLNAVQLRLSQRAGGAEIEVLAARRALEAAEAEEQRLQAELAGAAARLDELDTQLVALDSALQATQTG